MSATLIKHLLLTIKRLTMAHSIVDNNQSQLAIIDVQTRLCSVMVEADMLAMTKNCDTLLQTAKMLEVPVIVTEQYPEKLGSTTAELAQYFGNIMPVAKTVFSACGAPKFKAQLQRDRSQIILAGLEAHICVLQTALDLLTQGKQVFVVEDAIISRNSDNKCNAIARLRGAGCIITNTESVVFEWLRNADHPAFKDVSRLIK